MHTSTGKLFWGRLVAGAGFGILLATGCHRSSGVYTTTAGPSGSTDSGLAGPGVSGPGAVATDPVTGESAPLEPNPQITPGATLPVTKDDICVSGYSQKVRNVPESVKKQAYANYSITSHPPGEFEVDHLISLELGGSNSIKNLWPQSYKTQPWNAHVKDKLENALHADVCSDRIDLKTAQQEIASDWIGAYRRKFGAEAPVAGATGGGHRHAHTAVSVAPGNQNAATSPAATPRPAVQVSAPGAGAQVWVNLKSGKYFYQGSGYYGKTKRGEYLSEADAQRQGYVAAGGQTAPTQ